MENDPGGREKVEKQGMLLNTCGFAVGSRERKREREEKIAKRENREHVMALP